MWWRIHHAYDLRLLEDWIPYVLWRNAFRIGEDESEDFVRIRIHEGLDCLEIRKNGAAII